MKKCPICGNEYIYTVAEQDFLKHSVMIADLTKRLENIERKVNEKN